MNLWEAFAGAARSRPHAAPCMDAPDASLTWGEVVPRAEAAAALLIRHGVGPGDRVAYLGWNAAAQLLLVLACARLGAMLAPFNWRLAEEELAWQIGDADPRVVVADAAHAGMAARIGGARPVLDIAAVNGAEPGDLPTPQDGDLLLVYTSGTTGRPKGAVLTQAAVLANARLSHDMHAMTAEDHVLTALPMFHVGGLNIQTLPALLIGARVTLMDRFAPGPCLDLIAWARPSLTVQVPATLHALMADPRWAGADLSALRVIATGSTDVPVPLIRAVQDRGVPVIQIYGATETGPVAIYQRREHAETAIGSIGRAGQGVEVRLVASDKDVPDGLEGEIWLKSPALARGYWRNAAADDVFAGGWFRTGDIARRDADGFYWFTDRSKNVIISGGENIYPAELERVLRDLEGVIEAAVAGRADRRWGQVPVAVVVGDVARSTVLGAFDGHLARFKHPKDVVFARALPRNAMGKVDVAALRKMVALAADEHAG